GSREAFSPLKRFQNCWRKRILIGAERFSLAISPVPGSKTFVTCDGVTLIWRSGLLLSGPERLVNSSPSPFILNWKSTCFLAISRTIPRLSSFVHLRARAVVAKADSPWRSSASWSRLKLTRALPGLALEQKAGHFHSAAFTP